MFIEIEKKINLLTTIRNVTVLLICDADRNMCQLGITMGDGPERFVK